MRTFKIAKFLGNFFGSSTRHSVLQAMKICLDLLIVGTDKDRTWFDDLTIVFDRLLTLFLRTFLNARQTVCVTTARKGYRSLKLGVINLSANGTLNLFEIDIVQVMSVRFLRGLDLHDCRLICGNY